MTTSTISDSEFQSIGEDIGYMDALLQMTAESGLDPTKINRYINENIINYMAGHPTYNARAMADFTKKLKERYKKGISISIYSNLSKTDQVELRKCFPDYNIEFSDYSDPDTHSFTSAVRKIVLDSIYRKIKPTQRVIEVGCMLSESCNTKHPRIHPMIPRVDAIDMMRRREDEEKVEDIMYTLNASKQTTAVQLQLQSLKYMLDNQCRHTIQKCTCKADVYVAHQVVYTIPAMDFIKAMYRNEIKSAYVTFTACDEILFGQSICKKRRLHYSVTLGDDPRVFDVGRTDFHGKVFFHYYNKNDENGSTGGEDNQCICDLSTIAGWLLLPSTLNYKDHMFVSERKERAGVVILKIEQFWTTSKSTYSRLLKFNSIDINTVLVEIPYQIHGEGYADKMYRIYPREAWDRVCNYLAANLSSTDSIEQQIKKTVEYARSAASNVVIRSTVIRKGDINYDEIEMASIALIHSISQSERTKMMVMRGVKQVDKYKQLCENSIYEHLMMALFTNGMITRFIRNTKDKLNRALWRHNQIHLKQIRVYDNIGQAQMAATKWAIDLCEKRYPRIVTTHATQMIPTAPTDDSEPSDPGPGRIRDTPIFTVRDIENGLAKQYFGKHGQFYQDVATELITCIKSTRMLTDLLIDAHAGMDSVEIYLPEIKIGERGPDELTETEIRLYKAIIHAAVSEHQRILAIHLAFNDFMQDMWNFRDRKLNPITPIKKIRGKFALNQYSMVFDPTTRRFLQVEEGTNRVIGLGDHVDEVLVNDDLMYFHALNHWEVYKSYPVIDFLPVVERITHTDGVPGCTKTHTVATLANENDLCTSGGKNAAVVLTNRLRGMEKKTMCRTADSALLNETRRFERLIADEALMTHYGQLVFICCKCRIPTCISVGDKRQIPFVSFAGDFQPMYCTPPPTAQTITMNISRRIPQGVAKVLFPQYDKGVYTTSKIVNGLRTLLFTSIDELREYVTAGYKFLTYTQADKEEISRLLRAPVNTCGEDQGETHQKVILVRLQASDFKLYGLDDSGGFNPWTIVGLSRATDNTIYATPVADDPVVKLIEDRLLLQRDVYVSDIEQTKQVADVIKRINEISTGKDIPKVNEMKNVLWLVNADRVANEPLSVYLRTETGVNTFIFSHEVLGFSTQARNFRNNLYGALQPFTDSPPIVYSILNLNGTDKANMAKKKALVDACMKFGMSYNEPTGVTIVKICGPRDRCGMHSTCEIRRNNPGNLYHLDFMKDIDEIPVGYVVIEGNSTREVETYLTGLGYHVVPTKTTYSRLDTPVLFWEKAAKTIKELGLGIPVPGLGADVNIHPLLITTQGSFPDQDEYWAVTADVGAPKGFVFDSEYQFGNLYLRHIQKFGIAQEMKRINQTRVIYEDDDLIVETIPSMPVDYVPGTTWSLYGEKDFTDYIRRNIGLLPKENLDLVILGAESQASELLSYLVMLLKPFGLKGSIKILLCGEEIPKLRQTVPFPHIDVRSQQCWLRVNVLLILDLQRDRKIISDPANYNQIIQDIQQFWDLACVKEYGSKPGSLPPNEQMDATPLALSIAAYFSCRTEFKTDFVPGVRQILRINMFDSKEVGHWLYYNGVEASEVFNPDRVDFSIRLYEKMQGGGDPDIQTVGTQSISDITDTEDTTSVIESVSTIEISEPEGQCYLEVLVPFEDALYGATKPVETRGDAGMVIQLMAREVNRRARLSRHRGTALYYSHVNDHWSLHLDGASSMERWIIEDRTYDTRPLELFISDRISKDIRFKLVPQTLKAVTGIITTNYLLSSQSRNIDEQLIVHLIDLLLMRIVMCGPDMVRYVRGINVQDVRTFIKVSKLLKRNALIAAIGYDDPVFRHTMFEWSNLSTHGYDAEAVYLPYLLQKPLKPLFKRFMRMVMAPNGVLYVNNVAEEVVEWLGDVGYATEPTDSGVIVKPKNSLIPTFTKREKVITFDYRWNGARKQSTIAQNKPNQRVGNFIEKNFEFVHLDYTDGKRPQGETAKGLLEVMRAKAHIQGVDKPVHYMYKYPRVHHARHEGHTVPVVPALQDAIVAIVPTVFDVEVDYSDHINHAPKDYPITDMDMKLSKAHGPLTRTKIDYWPVIKSTRTVKRGNDQNEVITAVQKRNLEPNRLQLPGDDERFVENVIQMVLEKHGIDGWRDILDMYNKNPVKLSEEIFEDWVATQEGPKMKALLSKGIRNRLEMPFSEFDITVKREPKPNVDKKAVSTYQKLQVIAAHAADITALYSPLFRVLFDRLRAIFQPYIMINAGYTTDDLEAYLNQYYDGEDHRTIEMDFSSFDKTQGARAHKLKMRLYEILGLDPELLAIWDQSHKVTVNVAAKAGIKFVTEFQTKSGDGSTTIGNCGTTTFATLFMFLDREIRMFLCLGDDNLVRVVGPSASPADAYRFGWMFNIEAKIIELSHGYFCGGFVVPSIDGYKFIGDPIKRIDRLATYSNESEFLIKEQFKSFTDAVKRMDNDYDNNLLSCMIAERYKCDHNFTSAINTLYAIGQNYYYYRRLFRRVSPWERFDILEVLKDVTVTKKGNTWVYKPKHYLEEIEVTTTSDIYESLACGYAVRVDKRNSGDVAIWLRHCRKDRPLKIARRIPGDSYDWIIGPYEYFDLTEENIKQIKAAGGAAIRIGKYITYNGVKDTNSAIRKLLRYVRSLQIAGSKILIKDADDTWMQEAIDIIGPVNCQIQLEYKLPELTWGDTEDIIDFGTTLDF